MPVKLCRQKRQNPYKIIDQATKTLIDKLLLEKIPLAGIARVADVSKPWLQSYVNQKYQDVPRQVQVRVKKGRLTIQSNEQALENCIERSN